MTQTVGAKSMRNVDVLYSTTSSWLWHDISGTLNSIEVSGGDRITGEAYTADGEKPIVLFGKLEPIDVTGRIVYSEVTAEAFIDLEALYAAGTDLKLEWAPGGLATGSLLYRTGTTNLVQFGYPGGEVESGDPVLIEFAVKTTGITYARMTTASGTF
jgi:hypothetical protein